MANRPAAPKLRAVRARTILTMAPEQAPLDDAAVLLAGGRIATVGPRRSVLAGFSGPVDDLGDVVVMPGLVNAHVHLELAHLTGLSPRGLGFAAWAAWLGGCRHLPLTPAHLEAAIGAMTASGTAAVIDIATHQGAHTARALRHAGLGGLVCHEYFGFRPPPPGDLPPALAALDAADAADAALRLTVSGHALYSTSPDNLRRAKAICRRRGTPYCLHLAETQAELELLAAGTGPLAELLGAGVLPKGYRPPGRPPVAQAQALELLGPDTLAVHAVWLDSDERARLAASGAAVCLCPRSNAHIGVGRADAAALHAAGIPLCLGTDSPASNDDLDLWNEVRALVAEQPALPPQAVLPALTVTPARLLGREGELGRLVPGALGALSVIPDDLAFLADRRM